MPARRRTRKGGDMQSDVQVQLDKIETAVNAIKEMHTLGAAGEPLADKSLSSPSDAYLSTRAKTSSPSKIMSLKADSPEPIVPLTNKTHPLADVKFKNGGVSLALSRILDNIDKKSPSASKGNTTWGAIKTELMNATTESEVKSILIDNNVGVFNNQVAGSRRKKSSGKKVTHRRR
jgi:hypothetical protein